jgi:hypothetical protein
MGFNNVRQFQAISTGHARIENRAGRLEFLERDRRPQTFLTGGWPNPCPSARGRFGMK